MLVSGFNHVAVLTGDTDRLVAFYRDVFDATHELFNEGPGFKLTMVHVGPTAELNVFELDGSRRDEQEAYLVAGLTVLRQSDVLLAVWDGEQGGDSVPGDIVRSAVEAMIPVIWVKPGESGPRLVDWRNYERIVRREIDIDKALLSVMARVAIDRLGEHAVATIHLHPSDCEVALSQRDPSQPGPVEIVADVNLPRGGCLVRSAFGSVDMGIDSQMRELARALLGDDDEQEEPAHGLSADV